MKKLKWYTWSGKGKIPEGVESVLFRDGFIVDTKSVKPNHFFWLNVGDYSDIVAYTKGEIA